MPAIDTVLFNGTNSTLIAATPASGDSAIIRSFPQPYKAHLLSTWDMAGNTALKAVVSEIKSPRLHDAVHAIHLQTPKGQSVSPLHGRPQLPLHRAPQPFESQDNLEIDLQGDGTDTDTKVLQMYYEFLDGVNARFIDEKTLNDRGKGIFNCLVNPVTTNGVGEWEGGVAINSVATYDQLKAGRDYAFLGAFVDDGQGAGLIATVASLRGSDFGGLRLGVPAGFQNQDLSAGWFVRLTRTYKIPLIPVFSGSNKGSLICDIAGGDTAATTWNVVYVFQELNA